jgi:hypothetical protein
MSSAYGDSWAAGPAASAPPVPPRPDVEATPAGAAALLAHPASANGSYGAATLGPHIGNGTFAGSPAWQRVGVVLGVIFCFPFFLTIPGWLALRHRNKWKQGLVPLPRFLIFWGYLVSAVIVVAVIVSATAGGESDKFSSVGFTSVGDPANVAPANVPPTIAVPSGDEVACDWLRDATLVPPNSDRWNERLVVAESEASDDLYGAIDRVYWTLDDGLAAERLADTIQGFC